MKAGVPEAMVLAGAVAVIDEARCIGCTLCINVCPVDAIVGATKLMHTVISAACTGCELCMAPCPVDCITMRTVERPSCVAATADALRRCESRNARLIRAEAQKAAAAAARRAAAADARKRETIAAALERARQRLRSRA